MSYPFGGHPRLSEYIHWAMTEHGCLHTSGFRKVDGRMEQFQLIECAETGKHVFVFESQNEYIVPSTVSYLDRRLGLVSPFAKLVSYD